MKLEDLQVYTLSMEIGEDIWQIVSEWKYFEKDTIGKQLVRFTDSVAANISEGYGWYSYKENKHFCYYTWGLLSESKTWPTKVHNRSLLSEGLFQNLYKKLDSLSVKLNNYIKSIGPQ